MKTGPAFILTYATAREVKTHYYADSDDGRKGLKKALADLADAPLVYVVRVFREDTEAILAELTGPDLVA